MRNQKNIIIGTILIITIVLGFTNPDTNSHINAYLDKIESGIDQDTLIRNIRYKNNELAIGIKNSLLNDYKEGKHERRNFIIFSKIDNISIGLLNHVWVLPNFDEETIRRNLVFGLSKILDHKFETKYYSDIILICDEVLKGSKNGFNINGSLIRDGYFNSYRARCNMILDNNTQATKDIILLDQNNLASDWDYYTGYSASDKLGEVSSSLYYINKAIEKNDKEGSYYYWRAVTNHKIGNRNQSCSDIYKSKSLGYSVDASSLNYYCYY